MAQRRVIDRCASMQTKQTSGNSSGTMVNPSWLLKSDSTENAAEWKIALTCGNALQDMPIDRFQRLATAPGNR
jgi:hypothetical protein